MMAQQVVLEDQRRTHPDQVAVTLAAITVTFPVAATTKLTTAPWWQAVQQGGRFQPDWVPLFHHPRLLVLVSALIEAAAVQALTRVVP